MYYCIQMGDTAKARQYFARTEKADPNHMMIRSVRGIFALMDSVKWSKTAEKRHGYELGLAKGYVTIGLRELSIDQSLALLEEDPGNVGALVLLSQAYDVKDRRWPAVQVLQRLLVLRPHDAEARQKLEDLMSRM
jgi:hypothetical protein